MIDTVFFDWGGVIARDPGDDFLTQLLREHGASDEQAQVIQDTHMRRFMRGELSEKEYWDELRTSYGFTIPETISEAFDAWQGLIIDKNVYALIDEAHRAGKKVAILSNVIEPTYNALARAGCYDTFDVVIASCKVGYAKPQPEIYQLATKQLQTTPERSLFIDDKQRNLDPAIELGFKVVLAQSPQQIIRDVRQYLAE